jgi:hypothetical protein
VQCSRTFLARCLCERREHLKSQAATPSPRERTTLQGTPRKRTSPK